jgi:hypothetical protein
MARAPRLAPPEATVVEANMISDIMTAFVILHKFKTMHVDNVNTQTTA